MRFESVFKGYFIQDVLKTTLTPKSATGIEFRKGEHNTSPNQLKQFVIVHSMTSLHTSENNVLGHLQDGLC